MQVPPIDAALIRITPATARAVPSLALVVGQQLTARVVASGSGHALLDVGGQRLEARTALPLVPGQALELQVATLGAEVILRVLGGAPAISEQQWALAALASAHRTSSSGVPDPAVVLQMLAPAPAEAGADDVHVRLRQLLGELAMPDEAHVLAARLRDVLENSGVLFESRLRAWLLSLPGAVPAPGAPLPPAIAADLKVLLGLLARLLGDPARGAGLPARPASTRAMASPAQPAGAVATAAFETLRGAVLNRQVETAYHWVRDGTLVMDLPLAFDGRPVIAQLRFRRGTTDREAKRKRAGDHVPEEFFFDFALEPPGLGPIRVQAQLAGSRLGVRFLVARSDVAARIDGDLAALRRTLSRDGRWSVSAGACVDAAQATLEALPSLALPRGGSVLDALA